MKRPLSVVCLIVLFFLFLGTKIPKKAPPEYLLWEGQQVTVTGMVDQKERVKGQETDRQIIYLRLTAIENEQIKRTVSDEHRVICYLSANQKMPEIGSVIQATGKLRAFQKATNPGQFDAESYYQVLDISFQLNQTEIQTKSTTYSKWRETLYRARCYFADIMDVTLPQRDASIMKTMLLGDKKAADEERKELYRRNGIAHIQAISALHISVLGMSLYRILQKSGMPRLFYTSLPVILMINYGFMTGYSVSVVRAVGMFVMHMAAVLCKRTYDMVTATAVLAVCIVIHQPLYLYNSSFLLSFGCVLGIGLLLPALTKKQYKKEKQPTGFLLNLMSGTCISLAILPFQLMFFYQVPTYSVFLNMFVIPLMNLLLPLGVLLLVCGAMNFVIYKPVAFAIEVILNCYDLVCEGGEILPVSLINVGYPQIGRVLLYVAALVFVIMMQKKLFLKQKWIVMLLAVVMLLCPLPQKMQVTFLDVGQGDCIHILSNSGKNYLIDGGSSNVSQVGKYRILPYLKYIGTRELEAVFVTHPDKDHSNGISELLCMAEEEGIVIKNLYLPDIDEMSKTDAYYALVGTAIDAGVEVHYFSRGMCLQDGELFLKCLHPGKGYRTENENAYSLVLLVQCGGFDMLLTGDVEGEGEREMIRILKNAGVTDVEVLKVAHHGSRYSTTEEFLEQVNTEVAVISCGERNSYGHPHEEVLLRLRREGTAILTTSESGAITIKPGREMKVMRWGG